MEEDFAVHGRLENGPGLLEFVFQLVGVDQVPVVGHGIRLFAMVYHKGLGVGQDGAARCRIADVTDGAFSLELFEVGHIDDVGNQPHPLVRGDPAVFRHGDACALLAPVLEGVDAEIAQFGRFGVIIDAEQAAGFTRF